MQPLNNLFISRIKEQFSTEATNFLSAIDREPRTSVRINRSKNAPQFANATPIPWNADGMWLNERPLFTLDPLFHAGTYYPQEASSMVIGHILRSIEHLLPTAPAVLDLCAAPGGKSTLLASWLNNSGVLVANEIVRQRAWILRENIAKWGFGNCVVTNADSATIGQIGATFDLALIDAPCSGEGMFRKDDTARTEWSADNAAMCADRQKEIITNVWDSIAEGGIVIYSTCTFNPAENELQAEWINQHFDVEFISIPMQPQWGISTVPFSCGEGYAFYPHKVDGEGFFVCAMRKTSGENRRIKPSKKSILTEARNVSIPLLHPTNYIAMQLSDELIALPRSQATLLATIATKLRPIWIGTPLGKLTRKELIPAEELALQTAIDTSAYPIINLSPTDALHYLRGEWTYTQTTPQGWCIVACNNQPIGFVKAMGNRVNNYWPKDWRIRMQIS